MDYPKSIPGVYLYEGKFTDGTPDGTIPGSRDPAKTQNDIIDSILQVQAWTGEAPNEADITQLRRGIEAKIAASLPTISKNRIVIEGATFAGGVANGNPVRWNAVAGNYAKALADGTSADLAIGVADVTNSLVVIYGETRAGLFAGLTPGARYYLTAAGGLSTVAVADMIKVGIAKAADVLFVDIDAASGVVFADIGWMAGISGDGLGQDLRVQTYGYAQIARASTIKGEVASVGLAATGAALIWDVEKNGASIYTVKPQFAAGSTALTAGTLDASKVSCVSGDVLTFKVTQVGSTIRGQQLRATLKMDVA